MTALVGVEFLLGTVRSVTTGVDSRSMMAFAVGGLSAMLCSVGLFETPEVRRCDVRHHLSAGHDVGAVSRCNKQSSGYVAAAGPNFSSAGISFGNHDLFQEALELDDRFRRPNAPHPTSRTPMMPSPRCEPLRIH